jgi:8-amino-7-oxononanoate synthase
MKTNKPTQGLSDRIKDELIRKSLERRSRKARKEAGQARPRRDQASVGKTAEIPDEWTRFDMFPAYQQLRVLQTGAERLGIKSPFFRIHQGVPGRTTQVEERECLGFSSYNYLGLCGHPEVSEAAKAAIDLLGTSVCASRPVSGERALHRELEDAIARLYGVESCLTFVSGHATNVSTIGYLFGSDDLIVHDALIHNSAVVGSKLSGAARRTFPHNDLDSLDRLLTAERRQFQRVVIVVEGIYSMDGDYPDLPRLLEIKRRHKAFLMVDDAHALGVMGPTGKGIHEHFGIDGREVDIWMGTLSKALAACGGYIAGDAALVNHLKIAAPGFLYSVGMSPPIAAAARAALTIMEREPERVERLQHNGKLFLALATAAGIDCGTSTGLAVVPAITGSSSRAVRLTNDLLERGISAQPIIYPAVEEKAARVRFFMNSELTDDDIRFAVEQLRICLS